MNYMNPNKRSNKNHGDHTTRNIRSRLRKATKIPHGACMAKLNAKPLQSMKMFDFKRMDGRDITLVDGRLVVRSTNEHGKRPPSPTNHKVIPTLWEYLFYLFLKFFINYLFFLSSYIGQSEI